MSNPFERKKYRDAFVASFLRNNIAFQIRALREKLNLSQTAFAKKCGKPQNVISRLENPDYGQYTLNTLKELAAALDVGLLVRFVPFSELKRVSEGITQSELAVKSYEEEKQLLAVVGTSVGTEQF